jgi:hypothetical protein
MPLAPEKKVPHVQADFSSEFSAEGKNEFSWVPAVREEARDPGPDYFAYVFVFLGSIARN